MEVGNAARHRDWQMLGSDERLKLGFSDCFGSRWRRMAAAQRSLAGVALCAEQVQRVMILTGTRAPTESVFLEAWRKLG
jgi:hypothetical protein